MLKRLGSIVLISLLPVVGAVAENSKLVISSATTPPSCAKFRFGIVSETTRLDNGLTLPNFVSKSADFPNDVEIANYTFAKTVFSCSDSVFEGIGMTRVRADMSAEWSSAMYVVTMAALPGIQKSEAEAVIADAKASGEQIVGPYLITYKSDGAYPRYAIDVRSSGD